MRCERCDCVVEFVIEDSHLYGDPWLCWDCALAATRALYAATAVTDAYTDAAHAVGDTLDAIGAAVGCHRYVGILTVESDDEYRPRVRQAVTDYSIRRARATPDL